MRFIKLAPLAIAGLLAASTASAAPSVSIDAITFDADGAHLSGTSATPTPGEESVVTAPGAFPTITRFDPADTGPEAASALGLGLVDAFIAPIEGGLRFTWQLDSLPPTFIPEGVRYTWAFSIGSKIYQLQAKSSNLASATTAEDPQAHVMHATEAGNAFQLRGRCTPTYVSAGGQNVAGCYHLAFLSGGYDSATARVWMDLPYGQSFAPDFVPGAQLVSSISASANMSIAASLQAVISNATVSSYINDWMTYRTAPAVDVVSSSAPITSPEYEVYAAAATVAEDGSWTADIADGGTTDYYAARACLGATCAYAVS